VCCCAIRPGTSCGSAIDDAEPPLRGWVGCRRPAACCVPTAGAAAAAPGLSAALCATATAQAAAKQRTPPAVPAWSSPIVESIDVKTPPVSP
jgi:hypothetical protein